MVGLDGDIFKVRRVYFDEFHIEGARGVFQGADFILGGVRDVLMEDVECERGGGVF